MSNEKHRDALNNIILYRELFPVFQPIFDLESGKLFAYEALIRGPKDSALHSPMVLFEVAKKHQRLAALEVACRESSCEAFKRLALPGKLFLNFSPMVLIDPEHKDGITRTILERYQINPEQVVIELSEQYPMDDFELLRTATEHYRSMGFEIAIDDIGAGYSGLRVWSELHPDYVKIDRHFIHDLHKDKVKFELVCSIQQAASRIGTRVIAEGIEVEEELRVIQSRKIHYGQGFHLGRPESEPSISVENPIHQPRQANGNKNLAHNYTLQALLGPGLAVPPSTTVDRIADIFIHEPRFTSIVIVDAGYPKGIVSRTAILELLSMRFGRELFGKREVANYIEPDSIIFDHSTPLSEVSQVLTREPDRNMNLDFIITKERKYLGVGKIRDLLSKLSELQLESARYSNPLTLLPGNIPICQQIDLLLAENTNFHVAYFDLNFFKPFNDAFGYQKGDEVILCVADSIRQAVHPEKDFVGHVGGDDFIVIFQSSDVENRCQLVLNLFAERRMAFYSPQQIQQGGITAQNRQGEPQFFELISLAIGVVHPDPFYCRTHHEVSSLAADAKHQAKQLGGNHLFISRRRKITPALDHADMAIQPMAS